MFTIRIQAALLLSCVSAAYAYTFVRRLRTIGRVPGFRPLISPASLLGSMIPRTSWNPGLNWSWAERKTAYFNHTHDIISMVPVLVGDACYYTCSPDVLKQVLGNEKKTGVLKPQNLTLARLLGDSVASANGEVWRRHRRVVSPAFNSQIYQLVRQSSIDIYEEMAQVEEWSDKDVVYIPVVNKLVSKFALFVIARCEFGLPVSWSIPLQSADSLTFGDIINIVSESLITRLILPNWAYKLPIERLRNVDRAWRLFNEYVQAHMHSIEQTIMEQGEPAWDEIDFEQADILRCLITSSKGAGKHNLSDEEVMANVFILLFSGHETTASTISSTLGYLAIYQDEQEKAYREIKNLLSVGHDLGSIDINQFPYLQACFQESLRLVPAGFMLGRLMPEDLPVHVQRPEHKIIVLPKGSQIVMDLIAIHRNPNVFEEPDVFKPSRWLGVSEADLSMFGAGPRACLGRKFAHTEAVYFLASLLRDWVLDIDLPDGEIRSDYESKMMGEASLQGTALSSGPLPLKMRRRSKVD